MYRTRYMRVLFELRRIRQTVLLLVVNYPCNRAVNLASISSFFFFFCIVKHENSEYEVGISNEETEREEGPGVTEKFAR